MDGCRGQSAGSVLYGGKSMLFAPTTNATQCWPATFNVNNFGVSGSATLVTRLRWDGHAFSSSIGLSQLYFNGYGGGTGWIFGLSGGAPYLYSTVGSMYGLGTALTVGKWYELALVLTDNGTTDTVTCYLWPEGGTLATVTKSGNIVPSTAGTTTKIGCEFQYGMDSSDNAKRAFKGAVNHIAVWRRALSYGEVCEAMRAPYPAIFRVGLNNGIVNDLRAEYTADEEYLPNDPWHTMRRALTTDNRKVTLKIPFTATQAGADQVVQFDTTNGGSLNLTVNGTLLGSKSSLANQISWLVPASQFITGTNIFAITYEGSSWIGIDCVEIGGSWQVGTVDNSFAEFGDESGPDDFYVANPDLTKLERGVSSGDMSLNLLFPLSAELADRYAFTYTTRLINQGGAIVKTHPLKVLVNNTLVTTLPAQPNGTTVSVRINQGLMRAGENKITLTYGETANGWIIFDYHKLNVRALPGGTVITIR